MRIYFSYLSLMGSDLAQSIRLMREQGARHIELMLDGGAWDGYETRMEEFAGMLPHSGIDYSVHPAVWDINLTSENARAREAALQAHRDAIVFASRIGADHAVIHPGFCESPVFDKSAARGRALAAVQSLCEWNKNFGIQLLVENVGSRSTSIFNQEEYIEFILRFGGRVGSLLDIGHAHLCGWDLAETVRALGGSLRAVHLHDNDATRDAHRPIGEGTVPWDSVFSALASVSPDLKLILEYDIGVPAERLGDGRQLLLRTFLQKAISLD